MKKKSIIFVSVLIVLFIMIRIRAEILNAPTINIITFEKLDDYREVIDNSIDPNIVQQTMNTSINSNEEFNISNEITINDDEEFDRRNFALESNLLEDDIPISRNITVQNYKINDPDGYSNLRDAPNSTGKIIKRVLLNELFEVLGNENNWNKVKLSDGTIGFIHSSRVVKD